MWNQRPDPKIVIARGYAIVAGLVMILAAPLLILFAVFNLVSGDTVAAVLIVVVPLALGAGIWMAGLSTKIRFNPDSMTVNRGHIPLFLWWLRERTVSTVHRAWGYSCLEASKVGRKRQTGVRTSHEPLPPQHQTVSDGRIGTHRIPSLVAGL